MSTIISLFLYFFMLQQLFPYVSTAHFRVGCEGFFFFFLALKAIISSSKVLTFSFNILLHSSSSGAFEAVGVTPQNPGVR